jgi:hypothetical protein
VKDLLSAVGSGGGAAAAPAAGAAAAAGGAAAEEVKEEAKEEGELASRLPWFECRCNARLADTYLQRRRSRTRTWVSVSSTKLASTRAWRGFDSSDSLCSSKTCMDLRRHFAHTTTGMEAWVSGILVHRRSFTGNLKMRF